jgi:hypothetical protein
MRWRRRRDVALPEAGSPAAVGNGPVVIDRKPSGTVYEVHRAATEAAALAYLRGRDVRDEQYYVIVETPGRNLGRDLIMIFDEADGSLLEVPERNPLPDIRPSTTRCARCGYAILPATLAPAPEPEEHGPFTYRAVFFGHPPTEVIRMGWGYRCISCLSGACESCYQATIDDMGPIPESTTVVYSPGGQLHDDGLFRTCWVCKRPVTAFTE